MIQILSQTKKYVTFKMPIEMAISNDFFISYLNKTKRNIVEPGNTKFIKEVKPTKREIEAIRKGREEIKAGNFVSFTDIRKNMPGRKWYISLSRRAEKSLSPRLRVNQL